MESETRSPLLNNLNSPKSVALDLIGEAVAFGTYI